MYKALCHSMALFFVKIGKIIGVSLGRMTEMSYLCIAKQNKANRKMKQNANSFFGFYYYFYFSK